MIDLLRRISPLLVGFLFSLPATSAAVVVSGTLQGEAHWSGEIEISGPVTVAAGARLNIAPGSRIVVSEPGSALQVAGTLHVEGTANAPVTFVTPAGWEGISFLPNEERQMLAHVRFAGASTAVFGEAVALTIRHATFEGCRIAVKLVRGASAQVGQCRFIENRIGVDAELRSNIEIRASAFRGHEEMAVLAASSSRGAIRDNLFESNRLAIALLQPFSGQIHGNRFVANEVGVSCSKIQEGTDIVGNLFEKNEIGIKSEIFSRPLVSDNRFIENSVAMRNDQFAGGELEHNAFLGNNTALFNSRKANPRVARNLFQDNGVALFCDYSSYPQVRENNFLENTMAVRLGNFQSAAGAQGAGAEMAQRRAARSHGPLPAGLLEESGAQIDFVDVRGNWWGEDTRLLKAAGEGGNVSIFFDRRDQSEVTYGESGPRGGRLDWVRFAPWRENPVTGAGPRDESNFVTSGGTRE